MIRTQVQFTEEQARRLRELAAQRRVSTAAVVREAVDRLFETATHDENRDRLIEAIGGFRSGSHDIARRHDDYLGDDFT